jgi:hypothetical protein
MVFIDLKNAYDKIPKTVMWWEVEKHKVPAKYTALVRDMHGNVVTIVHAGDSETNIAHI